MRRTRICHLFRYNLFFYQIAILLAQEILEEQKESLDSLIFLHAVWRHGARTTSTLMATDKENNVTEMIGLGELTAKGFAQCYKLGQWIRKRYEKFLSSNYNSYEFFIRSSDYNRTLMSGQGIMAAIYPPTDKNEMEGLNWQPIPIHTTAKLNDKLIFDSSECQKVINEEKRIFTTNEVKQIETENMEFLQFLSEKSGYNNSFLPLKEMRYVFDSLYSNLENGFEMPKWVNESVRQRIWSLYDLSSSLLFSTKLIVLLKSGRLFIDIIDRMESILNDKTDKRQKFFAYSAHDTTVAGILAAFGVKPSIFPRFSSLVLIELHKADDKNWVRLFYKNESKSDALWEWPIEGCPSICSLERLKTARDEFLSLEEPNECLESHIITREKIYIASILILSFLSASLMIYILFGINRKKPKSYFQYVVNNDFLSLERADGDHHNLRERLLSHVEDEIELNEL